MKSEKEIATIEDFLNGEAYDYVIEHIWLLLNYVSTYCNHHMGFKNNDWSIFPLLFKRDFLYPLQEQWLIYCLFQTLKKCIKYKNKIT